MLKVKNLHVSAEGRLILKGIDLLVKPGEVHVIMGPNGSGKTSLAFALLGHPGYEVMAIENGEQKSDKGKQEVGNKGQKKVRSETETEKSERKKKTGEVRAEEGLRRAVIRRGNSELSLDGVDLSDKTPDQRAKMGLFLAFQNPISIEGVSVQNFLRRVNESINGRSKVSVLEFRRMLIREAEKLGIKEDLLNRSVNEGFSGGEKKRLEILQLIVSKPKYAILDETDSGLDIDAIRIISQGVKRHMRLHGDLGVIIITHYQRILQFIKPDFVHVMVDGRIVKSGGYELARLLEKNGYKDFHFN